MACSTILNGLSDACFNSFVGGLQEIYILDKLDLSGYTLNTTTEVISGLTLAVGKKFKTYKLNSKTASTLSPTATISPENGTIFYTNEVSVKFYKMNAVTRLELKNLSIGNLVVLVLDGHGFYWILGIEAGCTVSSIAGTSGGGRGDFNGYDVVLQEISRYAPFKVEIANIMTLLDQYAMTPISL